MKSGRPPLWNPVASLSVATWTEVVAVTSKSRVQLPIAARSRLGWALSTDPLPLLATLEPQGNASLEPWEPSGDKALGEVEKMLAREPQDSRAELALLAMDRYLRVTLDPDGRMLLPANLAYHVGAIRQDAVRVIVVDGRLQLWSEVAWQEARSSRLQTLSGRLAE